MFFSTFFSALLLTRGTWLSGLALSLLLWCSVVLMAIVPRSAAAQFLSATVRIDGLTCSLCHLSVHKAIKKLDFVEQAAPNIDEVSLDLTFKRGAVVSFDKVASAIQDAGFTVGALKAKFYFQNVNVDNDEHLAIGGVLYHIVSASTIAELPRVLNGVTEMTLIDKQFVSKEDFEKWQRVIHHSCYRTGTSSDCCPTPQSIPKTSAKTPSKPQRVYHVVL